MWSLLVATLPTRPNAARMRLWRRLKALGCAALRDGAYLLPETRADDFHELADELRSQGGTAMVLRLEPTDGDQRNEVLALFDRSEAYAQWQATAAALQADIAAPGSPQGERRARRTALPDEADARRRLRAVAEALEALRRIDHYPGAAAEQAESDLAALRRALDERYSRGEPQPRAAHGIARLDRARFQGRRWATRARPWVDRLASAWLIKRFIDPQAQFVWLDDPAQAPRGALGFDFDGARFTHMGARVSFEVLAASFGLEGDSKLQRIAQAVRYLDAGGIPVPEAAGLETVLAGLREMHADDDALAVAAGAVFDALYAAPGAAA